MAPTSTDPKDLLLVLNPARRRALVQVTGQIISHMRSEIEDSFHSSAPLYEIPPPKPPRPQNARPGNAPLFVEKYDMTPKEDADDIRRRREKLERSISSPKLHELKVAALKYFDAWERSVREKLRELMNTPEDPRQRRPPPPPSSSQPTLNPESEKEAAEAEAKELAHFQSLYAPIGTRLATVSKQDRKAIISSMLLLLLSLQHYSSHSRVLLCYLTSSLDLPISVLTTEETETARTLLLASKSISTSTDTAVAGRANTNAVSRKWKVGLASVAGAALIGVTGGLAAPVVAAGIGTLMGGVGLGGLASFLGVFAMNGVFMGSLFGVVGGKMMGEKMEKYTKSVEDFKFVPVVDGEGKGGRAEEKEGGSKDSLEEDIENRRLRVTIGVNGWLMTEADVVKPWKVLGDDSEAFALRYELDSLIKLGTSLESIASRYAWPYVKIQVLKSTVLAAVSATMFPIALLSMAGTLDSPFALAKNRSEKAGEVLADALINKTQGERPVTLIGYSLGSRVIYSCLRELSERRAFGLVESVVMIGSPVPSDTDNWRAMKSVVSGKMVNVYSENDYILGFMYRATSIQLGIAGLQAIEDVAGVKNLDLTERVAGHLRYPGLIGKILRRAGFTNVLVDDDEIIEKEDEDEGQLLDLTGDMDPDAEEITQGKYGSDSAAIQLSDLDANMAALEVHKDYVEANGPPVQRIRDHDDDEGLDALEVHREYIEADCPPIQLLGDEHEPKLAHVTKSMSQLPIASKDYDSDDSGAGGIQMIDNDDDYGDDDGYPDDKQGNTNSAAAHVKKTNPPSTEDRNPRDAGKVHKLDEQKTLGSFPKEKRVTGSDMGLY
ncbi:hypothetical protein B7463_g3646, partial [Scytalidium lignicola]